MKPLLMVLLTAATLAAGLIGPEVNARRSRRGPPRCQHQVQDCGRTTNIEKCMTCNAVREGLIEGFEGMVKANRTVIARAKSGLYPANICAVIYQKSQFSWTTKPRTCVSAKNWARAKESAKVALEKGSNGKLYYHANYVKPSWASKCVGREQAAGEKHIFYEFCGNAREIAQYRRNTQERIASGTNAPANTSSAAR